MNKLPAMLTAGIIASSLNAFAADAPGTPVNLIPNTAAAAPAAAPASAQPAAETEELKDGTKIEISDDNTVTIINPDGTRSIAPDGILTLKDQTTFDVKDGKKLNY